jgi:hypothetical protein
MLGHPGEAWKVKNLQNLPPTIAGNTAAAAAAAGAKELCITRGEWEWRTTSCSRNETKSEEEGSLPPGHLAKSEDDAPAGDVSDMASSVEGEQRGFIRWGKVDVSDEHDAILPSRDRAVREEGAARPVGRDAQHSEERGS